MGIETRTVTNSKAEASIDNDGHELEQQFILRLPLAEAEKLSSLLEDGSPELKDRFLIQIHPDMRDATVQFDDTFLKGTMMDLPSIIESLKTFDRKTFYKITDISQMLLIKSEAGNVDTPSVDSETKSTAIVDGNSPKKPDKKFLWNHGITPPLKNVRKRRFRKTRKKKFTEDAIDLDKELKRLLRADMEAVSVRHEIKAAKERREQLAASGTTSSSANVIVKASGKAETGQRGATVATSRSVLREHDLFGGQVSSSSSESEDNEQEEEEEEGEAMARELMGQMRPHKPARLRVVPQSDSEPTKRPKDEDTALRAVDERQLQRQRQIELLESQLETLKSSIARVQQQKRIQEAQIKTLENPALRERMISDLEVLSDEEISLKSQICGLEDQLGSWKQQKSDDEEKLVHNFVSTAAVNAAEVSAKQASRTQITSEAKSDTEIDFIDPPSAD